MGEASVYQSKVLAPKLANLIRLIRHTPKLNTAANRGLSGDYHVTVS